MSPELEKKEAMKLIDEVINYYRINMELEFITNSYFNFELTLIDFNPDYRSKA